MTCCRARRIAWRAKSFTSVALAPDELPCLGRHELLRAEVARLLRALGLLRRGEPALDGRGRLLGVGRPRAAAEARELPAPVLVRDLPGGVEAVDRREVGVD